MKKFLFILFLFVVISELAAQNSDYKDISALLENKIWEIPLPSKRYAMEMEFLGNVVIKPQFKFAFPFENWKAKVTFSGESKAVSDSKDEKHNWCSPDWYYII